jgi:hypothetical protein
MIKSRSLSSNFCACPAYMSNNIEAITNSMKQTENVIPSISDQRNSS